MEIGIFLSGGLDRANQLEETDEIGVSAPVIFGGFMHATRVACTELRSRLARRAGSLTVALETKFVWRDFGCGQ